ncbi:MAG: Crp/Fnr family transcriptional regulator [Opitutaceae bacterium]|jgi:CRP/FNR family transcriptional regulator|nr:Crp/Fnr family transcriptional regulator [Opitutaceae bacterium]
MQSAPAGLGSLRQAAISATLRQSRLFSSLSPADLALVAEGCSLRGLQRGEMLFREGEKSEGFYVMQTGSVSIYKVTPDGREQIICVFRPPESFAEVTLATVETYPANGMALEPSQVIVVNKARFRDLIRRQPELSLHMLGSMSLHLKHLVQSLQDIKGRQIEHRLAEWLMQQSPAAALGCPVEIQLQVSKKVLAGQLGVTSETLSRTFARFRAEGLIQVKGASIRIVDGAKLSAYRNV